MQIIKPSEISGKIMSLIREAKELLIIVSPYNKIYNWDKFLNVINKPQKRGINIEWYIRKNEGSSDEIKKLGITPFEIENLHAKIYLNEKEAIVASMNLHSSSDAKSIDIGYITKTNEEYLEVVDFVNEYIKTEVSIDKNHLIIKKTENIIPNELVSFNSNDNKRAVLEEQVKSYIKSNPLLNKLELKIATTKKSWGNVYIPKFKDNYEIEIESGCRRLIVNILGDYKYRSKKYVELCYLKNKLENESGFKIDYGNQMMRLKFDLTFEEENFKNIIPSNDTIIARIDKIVQTLQKNLN